jgi:hypothetical protein
MKKSLLILILLLAPVIAFCQNISYGIFGGLNETRIPAMFYKNESYANVTQSGLSIGFVSDIKLGTMLSFQPGVYYTIKGGTTKNDTVEISTGIPRSVGTTKMSVGYAEIPLNLLFNAKVARATFFAGGGPYFGLKAGSSTNFKGSVEGANSNADYSPPLKSTDLGFDITGGIKLANGFTLKITYEKSFSSIYDDQPGAKNQTINYAIGYFFK